MIACKQAWKPGDSARMRPTRMACRSIALWASEHSGLGAFVPGGRTFTVPTALGMMMVPAGANPVAPSIACCARPTFSPPDSATVLQPLARQNKAGTAQRNAVRAEEVMTCWEDKNRALMDCM